RAASAKAISRPCSRRSNANRPCGAISSLLAARERLYRFHTRDWGRTGCHGTAHRTGPAGLHAGRDKPPPLAGTEGAVGDGSDLGRPPLSALPRPGRAAAAARPRRARRPAAFWERLARRDAVRDHRPSCAWATAAAGRVELPRAQRPYVRHSRRQAGDLVLLARRVEPHRRRGGAPALPAPLLPR